MARRAGVQSEVLLGLALVMVLATVLLSAVWVARHESSLRAVLGPALLAEARSPRRVDEALFAGTDWWVVGADARARPRGGVSAEIDPATRALAEAARKQGRPLLRPGALWEPIRFAAPLRAGEVAVGRLPEEASFRLRAVPLAVAGAVLVADAAIFTAFGAGLLRRRVVRPLQDLAGAARRLADGEPGTRVAVEGAREVADLGRAFNEMTEALERRSQALEKAVSELREANADLRRARAGLDRAERLAAVGRLAAGVAHEVGNPIGAILAFVDLAARDPGIAEATRAHLERAAREGGRVRTILRQLLDFSRPPRPRPAEIDLARAAEEAVALLRAQRRYDTVRFEVVREEGAPAARADAAAVGQILLNLLLNAADALAGVEAPRVELRVRAAALHQRAEDAACGERPLRRRPDGVECLVSDNGCGVAEADRERIFDPFFSTKPPGEGTGLGLANAHRLAEELEGVLEWAAPPAGARTAFSLRLPVAGAPDGRVREPPAGAAQCLAGSGDEGRHPAPAAPGQISRKPST